MLHQRRRAAIGLSVSVPPPSHDCASVIDIGWVCAGQLRPPISAHRRAIDQRLLILRDASRLAVPATVPARFDGR